MPAVSLYLRKDLLTAVKAKARNVPASRIIQEAVENYLSLGEKRTAFITDIQNAIEVVSITPEVALRAGHIAQTLECPAQMP